MVASRTSREMIWTASRSPGVEQGKPASMMSTPSFSSCFAISSFSSGVKAIPADCSPSRRVVSKMWIFSGIAGGSSEGMLRSRSRLVGREA